MGNILSRMSVALPFLLTYIREFLTGTSSSSRSTVSDSRGPDGFLVRQAQTIVGTGFERNERNH